MDDMAELNIYSLGSLMKSFAYSCILFFIEALIVAAIIKKKKPELEF